MVKSFIRIVFIVLGVLSSCVSIGQGYAVKKFTVDDGLPSSHVYEVKQDAQGFYWICTTQGLVKYDGYTFERIKRDENVSAEEVWWTHQDTTGKMWCLYTGNKLWYREGDSFSHIPLFIDDDEGYVNESTSFRELITDQYGNCWLTMGSGLYRLKDGELAMYKRRELTDNNEAAFPSIHKVKNDMRFITKCPITVWKSNPDGKPEKEYVYTDDILMLNHQIPGRGEVFNENNTVFVFKSYDSLYTIHNKRLKGYFKGGEYDLGEFPAAKSMKYESYKVIPLNDKYAFINSDGNFMTDGDFNHLPEFSFMEGYNINTIYEDHEGSIWISTTNQGLLYITKDALAVESYDQISGLNSEVVGIKTVDTNEGWVAFKNGNLACFKNGEILSYRAEPSSSKDRNWFLRDIEISGNYLVLIVGNYEVQLIDMGTISGELLKPKKIYELTQLRKLEKSGGKLFAHDFVGVWELRLALDKPAIAVHKKSTSIGEDAFGDFYVSSYGGVDVFSADNDSTHVSDVVIKKFVLDPSGLLWGIGNAGGAYSLSDNNVEKVEILNNYLLHDIWFEGDTVLWAATNEGLVQFHRTQKANDYAYSRKLTLANGLLTNEVTVVTSDANYLYVGTSKGYNVVNKKKLSKPQIGHLVQLTSISSKGEKFGLQQEYQLAPDHNAIDFSYVYVSPKSEGHINYQYKLDGIDNEWHETRKTSVSYPFLPAGNYVFHLRAQDINGVSSENEVELKIWVGQYWWQTNWFKLGSITMLIAIVIAFYRIRMHRLKQREKEQTVLNTRMAELKLKALQSQMDPHFVFNVLNGVQDSYMNNNVAEANKYLTDFAKLMRLFLDASDKKYISLNKEIKLLTYYIELERMRLGDKFDYKFKIDDNIETDEVSIPSMLLQPIIENAIKHGFKHKEGQGELIIEINQGKNEELLIAVEDNGIGREKAELIKKRRKDAHLSRASNIIEERIGIINNSEEGNIDLKYIDIMDTGRTGTRVELIINLEINKENV